MNQGHFNREQLALSTFVLEAAVSGGLERQGGDFSECKVLTAASINVTSQN